MAHKDGTNKRMKTRWWRRTHTAGPWLLVAAASTAEKGEEQAGVVAAADAKQWRPRCWSLLFGEGDAALAAACEGGYWLGKMGRRRTGRERKKERKEREKRRKKKTAWSLSV